MSLERWIPLGISRGSRSFFDPSWEIGSDWDDFMTSSPRRPGALLRRSDFDDDFMQQRQRRHAASNNQYHLERKMERMQNDMDRFFNNVGNMYSLAPVTSSLSQSREPIAVAPRSPMSRRHLRLHATGESRLAASSSAGLHHSNHAASLSPLALRAAEDVTVEHPVVVDKHGIKKLELNFDVRAFRPDEIQVKTKDNEFIEVHASHEEKSDTGLVKREYHRMFSIPQHTQVAHMTSLLSPEGVLTIEAPMKNQREALDASPRQTSIAISHE